MQTESAEQLFLSVRPQLVRLAYRMLGSLSDAEDIVQDAYLRWRNVDADGVLNPTAYLKRTVSRLCLNALKKAYRRRETYIGPWLPEPVIEAEADRLDDISLPLMMALEGLSPLERAVFLLHDIFGASFREVSQIVGRNEAACRKLASRARDNLQAHRKRYVVTREHALEIASAFYTASREGDLNRLRGLLARDVVAAADGGGKVSSSMLPLVGVEAILSRHAEMAHRFAAHPSELLGFVMVDGLPGFASVEEGIVQTTALELSEDGISRIYVMRNPDKTRFVRQQLAQFKF